MEDWDADLSPCNSPTTHFLQKEALLSPCKLATAQLTACILNVYLPLSGGRTVPSKGLFKKNAPFILFFLMGSVARTLFSWTLLSWPILSHSGQILHSNVLEHLVWSNTSGFQFWGPLARTNFLSALCGLPTLTWRPMKWRTLDRFAPWPTYALLEPFMTLVNPFSRCALSHLAPLRPHIMHLHNSGSCYWGDSRTNLIVSMCSSCYWGIFLLLSLSLGLLVPPPLLNY